MAKFSKGDIVKVTDTDSNYYGEILIADENGTGAPCCLDVNGIYRGCFREDNLTLATGYDAIVKGTVLKYKKDNVTHKVLGICGDVYHLSTYLDHKAHFSCFTRQEIEESFEPLTPTEDKGIEVFDKEGKSLGFMKEGKVITN